MTCPGCGAEQAEAARSCTSCGASLIVGLLEYVDRNDPAHALKPRSYDIGRAAENDLSVLHASVSRRHARLTWEDGGFAVEDLGSRLGSFVDDTPVRHARLKPGAILRLGEVRLRYSVVEPRPAEEAAAPTITGGTLAAEQGTELLLSVVEALDSSLVLDDVLEKIVAAVMKISGAERGFVLLEPEGQPGGDLVVRVARSRAGAPPPDPQGISRTVLGQVRSNGRSVVTGDAANDPGLRTSDSVMARAVRTIVCLPLLSPRRKGPMTERVVGAIYLDNQSLVASFHAERVRAMEALARHAGLALEIARLFEHEEVRIRELERAHQTAVQASRAKGAFLANMTHELHTPLNAIINYAEMVLERAREIGETDMSEDAVKIRASGRHLLRIVDDVLDMTRLQEGSVALNSEPIDLSWLVSDLVDKNRPQMARNGNTLELRVRDELGSALMDGKRVRQALGHLMSNAAKFTQQGTVVLEAWREAANAEGAPDWIHFEIADTGIGMSDEQRERLFEPFSQADASLTRRYEGTGLGLALTRRICEAMGGSIGVQSTPGAGSRFHLRFPAQPPSPATPA